MERRALFLSKVQAPPSPTAALTPKTPPESPAIFHFTLPSPGLESPGEVFESLGSAEEAPQRPWVEQVDFRLSSDSVYRRSSLTAPALGMSKKQLPTLDQITARLESHRRIARFGHELVTTPAPTHLPDSSRLPRSAVEATQLKVRVPLPAGVGRLRFPVRSETAAKSPTARPQLREPTKFLPPASPTFSPASNLEIVTTLVPCTASVSPSQFTEDNISAFNGSRPRTHTANNMLSRLRRRTLAPAALSVDGIVTEDDMERKIRRRSAPPELPKRERVGFKHPVLTLPGAF